MEYNVTEALTRAGVDLATLAVKGTATMVTSKIQSIKDVKDAATLRATYDDLINELLAEREQAIGGPLTEACATAIKNKFITQNSKGKRK